MTFCTPQALQDQGGWLNRDIAGWFADYATLAGRRYGDRVKRFVTFNEPAVFTLFGYWNKAYIQAGGMERICRPTDWFGLNHYSPVFARADGNAPLGFAWADAGRSGGLPRHADRARPALPPAHLHPRERRRQS